MEIKIKSCDMVPNMAGAVPLQDNLKYSASSRQSHSFDSIL